MLSIRRTPLKDVPLKKKLTIVILLTSGFSLLFTGAAIIGYEISVSRKTAVNELATLSAILGANNTGALVFNDAETAHKTLETLRDQPSILGAGIYNQQGGIFATYVRVGKSVDFPAPPRLAEHEFRKGQLQLFTPILLHGDRIGTVYLSSNLEGVKARLERYAGIVFLAICLMFIGVLIVSIRLQRIVSDPILNLANVAKGVAERKDYSVRAPKAGNDEIGILSDTFNQMLETIEARDSALRNANQILQAEVVERRRAESALQQNRHRLELAQKVGNIGVMEWNWQTKEGAWTEELETLYGFPPNVEDRYKAWLDAIDPDDRPAVEERIDQAVKNKTDYDVEFRVHQAAQGIRWITSRGRIFYDEGARPLKILGIHMDITVRKISEQKLTQQAEELWRSNKELEQFAYVSSHDLKEPLRKIASYAQLLEMRYQKQLDEEGKKFLSYMVNGVRRMQNLIQDLLAYSRSGKEELKFERVDMKKIVMQAIADLEASLTESKGAVTYDPLPVIYANGPQMQQLLQNLLSNAIKFHGEKRPEVHIAVKSTATDWVFSVSDNGIGIDRQYQEQIFKIFQRLHNRSEYPGTGIGLAICKKIVERHHGQIWVESKAGEGSTFFFSLPKNRRAADVAP